MEKLYSVKLATIALFLSASVHAAAVQDSVRIAVGKISIKDMSPKRGTSIIELSDYVVLQFALHDSTFMPFKISDGSKDKQRTFDFRITGKGTLSASNFYTNLTLVDKFGKEFPLDPIIGSPLEFSKKLDETLQAAFRYVKTNLARKPILQNIGFAVRGNARNKNGLVPNEVINDLAQQVVSVFSQAQGTDVKLVDLTKSGASVDRSILERNNLDCLLYADFSLGDNLSINVAPRLIVKGFDNPIEMPTIEISVESNVDLFRKGIGADFVDLFSFITRPDGSWNENSINALLDVIKLPSEVLKERTLLELKRKNYFLSMFYAGQGMKFEDKNFWYPQVIGINRYSQERYEEAIMFLNRSIALNNRIVFSHLLKAEAARRIPNYSLSMKALDEVEQLDPQAIDSEFGDVKLVRGVNYYFMDSADLAIRNLKNAERIDHNHSQFRNKKYYLASSYYLKRQFSTSIEEFDDYLKYFPKDEAMRRHKGDVYADWGFDEYMKGNFLNSWQLYKTGLDCGTTNSVAWSAVLFPLNKLKKFETADSLIKVGIKRGALLSEHIYYSNALVLYELAEGEDSEQFSRKAIEYLNRHLEEVANDAVARAMLGSVYNSLKDYSRGTKALREAIDLNKKNLGYKLDLAEAYIMAGRPKDVSSVFDPNLATYQSEDPGDYALLLYLKYVASLVISDLSESARMNEEIMRQLNDILSKDEKIITDWSYHGFDEWLNSYKGKSRSKIEELTKRMKNITSNE